jgi:hypothetical protein
VPWYVRCASSESAFAVHPRAEVCSSRCSRRGYALDRMSRRHRASSSDGRTEPTLARGTVSDEGRLSRFFPITRGALRRSLTHLQEGSRNAK